MKQGIAWVGGLFVLWMVWSFAMADARGPAATSLQEAVGVAIGAGVPIFAATGFVSGIVYAVTKNRNKALWTWTILLLGMMAFLAIGAARLSRP